MSQQENTLRLTNGSIMGDSVHAEGELLARVLQQFTTLREGLGNHLALLDSLGFIITVPSQPENRRGRGWQVQEQLLPASFQIYGKTWDSK